MGCSGGADPDHAKAAEGAAQRGHIIRQVATAMVGRWLKAKQRQQGDADMDEDDDSTDDDIDDLMQGVVPEGLTGVERKMAESFAAQLKNDLEQVGAGCGGVSCFRRGWDAYIQEAQIKGCVCVSV